MRFRATTFALLVCMVACAVESSTTQRERVVRVSSSAGLGAFHPGPGLSGATAAALDLVYESTKEHAAATRVDALRVAFDLHAASAVTADEFSARFVCLGSRVEGSAGSRVLVSFEQTAQADFAESGYCGLDIGPYAVESATTDAVVLRRRGSDDVDRLELVRMTRAEEWRRLMARQVQIVPKVDGAARSELADLASVRLIDVPGINSLGLFFNLNSSTWGDVALRRALASAIDTGALGRMVCGGVECGSTGRVSSIRVAQMPATVVILVLDGESTQFEAARVLRHQLRQIGMEVEIEVLPLDAWVTRILSGQYELALSPIAPNPALRARMYLSKQHAQSLNISGYSNAEYDEAFERGDMLAMDALVGRDVPALPLFTPRDFAAIDSSLCGDVEPSVTSWRWIADLHPCEP